MFTRFVWFTCQLNPKEDICNSDASFSPSPSESSCEGQVRAGQYDVERVFVVIVVRDVERSGAQAADIRSRGELNGEGRARIRGERYGGVRGDGEFRQVGPVLRDGKVGQVGVAPCW